MKTKTKGIIMFLFLGGIMVTSGVLIAVPGVEPPLPGEERTITGTPADSYPDASRAQFCQTGQGAGSTPYVTEYAIPTDCTQPLAIALDLQGTPWFVQTNTGMVASLDPETGEFSEYPNPAWPEGGRSMSWGADYAGGAVWYTDEAHDLLWRFSTDDKTYSRISYEGGDDALPQRIKSVGSSLIVNDFTGGRITVIEPAGAAGQAGSYVSVPSPVEGSVASDFAADGSHVWYANWVFGGSGVLVRLDKDGYMQALAEDSAADASAYAQAYPLPDKVKTPNGVEIGPQGRVWIADTSSSSLYAFDPQTKEFAEYVTSPVDEASYGNATGVIRSPISRPYWIERDGGALAFNAHAANRIGVLDPAAGTLVEYEVPSRNPNWADCGIAFDCGLAQVFGIAASGGKVWFTEWVENAVGVVDRSVPLPFGVSVEPAQLRTGAGGQARASFMVSGPGAGSAQAAFASPIPEISVYQDGSEAVIAASPEAPPGKYMVLLGASDGHVGTFKYAEVTVS